MNATRLSATIVSVCILSGCTQQLGPGTGEIRPGHSQSMSYARALIEQGGVPAAADIAIEGLFAEYELSPDGSNCDSALCARSAFAIAPDLSTGELAYWAHVGMDKRIGFERPPLDLVVAIDKSASMMTDMSETNEAVIRLIGQLRADDRLAIITFDSNVTVIKEFGHVDDLAALQARVADIRAGGLWDLDHGMSAAYRILRDRRSASDRLQRVMVFSCGHPTLSETSDDLFSQLMHVGALEGIGLSFFGVLLEHDPQVAQKVAREMGGVYRALEDFDRLGQLFQDEFDAMVTPVAYAWHMSFTAGRDFEIARVFGVPEPTTQASVYEMQAATAFSGDRDRVMVVRLDYIGAAPEAPGASDVGTLNLSFVPEMALGFDVAEEQSLTVFTPTSQPADDMDELVAGANVEMYFDSLRTRKAIALANLGERLHAACAAYHRGAVDDAIAMLRELATYISFEADTLSDHALAAEVQIIQTLIVNMSS